MHGQPDLQSGTRVQLLLRGRTTAPRTAVITALITALVTALGLVVAGAALEAGQLPLKAHQPIATTDRLLRRQGWLPDGDPDAESFDRELSGNDLRSLRSCSGTGAGFCRYDYRRGGDHLEVITVPSRDGDGLVHHWRLHGTGHSQPTPAP